MINPFRHSQNSPLPEPSDRSFELRTTFGGRPADIADKLPESAREKLKTLRDEAEASRSWVSAPYQRGKEKRDEIQQIERRISELSRNGIRDDDKLLLAEKAGLERFRAESRGLAEEHAQRKEISRTIAGLAKRVEDYVEGLGSRRITLAPTTAAPSLAKGQSLADAIQKIRQRIENLQDEEQGARDAPFHSSVAKSIARDYVERLAEQGAPNVLSCIEGGQPPVFATHAVGFGLSGTAQIDVLGLFVWTHRDALIFALESKIDAEADDGSALSDDERADRVAGARREILSLERSEEALIVLARSTGLTIQRRADADPRALLQLADQMPWVQQ